MGVNGMPALPLLMGYRHTRLWTEVRVLVRGWRMAVTRPTLRLFAVLAVAMRCVALMGGAVVMPLGWARLSEAGQRRAEHQRGAQHGQGFFSCVADPLHVNARRKFCSPGAVNGSDSGFAKLLLGLR